jgi:hypothetical protein
MMQRTGLIRFSILILAIAGAGCASVPKRNPVPPNLGPTANVPWLAPEARSWADAPYTDTNEMMAQSRAEIEAEFPEIIGRPHNYLAISGGGANGAFGAGLLVGWAEAGDRPEFTLVTGISTGALTAPFAFLGPDYDDELHKFYTTVTTKDIANKRNLVNMLKSDAAASSQPLQDLLVEVIDEEMMEAIATEHRRGRRLIVGTTNLDAGRPVAWDIGDIAITGHPDALQLIRDVILASAALPGAFPPVLIEVEAEDGQRYDELHVDGGATSQVFLYPAGLDWDAVMEKLDVPGRPEVYIIRNSKLDPVWKTTNNKLFKISGRTISSLIRTQGIGDLYRIYMVTQRDGLDFNLAYIPEEFEHERKEQFDPEYMSALFDVGYRLAKSGYPWKDKPPELDYLDED